MVPAVLELTLRFLSPWLFEMFFTSVPACPLLFVVQCLKCLMLAMVVRIHRHFCLLPPEQALRVACPGLLWADAVTSPTGARVVLR